MKFAWVVLLLAACAQVPEGYVYVSRDEWYRLQRVEDDYHHLKHTCEAPRDQIK